MSQHLQREMEGLRDRVLRLCAAVEKSVALATRAVERQDAALAREVIESDDRIDMSEVSLEEECLKVLALHQPVAVDLRMIVAIMKMTTDLERIADLAVNIAERAVELQGVELPAERIDYADMGTQVLQMLRDAVDSLVKVDVDLARKVSAADAGIDAMHLQTYEHVKSLAARGYANLDVLIHMLSISRYLERIGDHATNIAEDVIYIISGEIVRHRSGNRGASDVPDEDGG